MANRFWVGGSGEMSDTSKWSASSGGAGGASVPSTGDVAIIDANSFSANGVITMTGNFELDVDTFNASGLDQNVTVEFTDSLFTHNAIRTAISFVGNPSLLILDVDPTVQNANEIECTGSFNPNATNFHVRKVSLIDATLEGDYEQEGYGKTYIIGDFDADVFSLRAGAFFLQPSVGDTILMGSNEWIVAPTHEEDSNVQLARSFEAVIGAAGTIDGETSTIRMNLSEYVDATRPQFISGGRVYNDLILQGNGATLIGLWFRNTSVPGTGPFFNNITVENAPFEIELDADAGGGLYGLTASYTSADSYDADGVLDLNGSPSHQITIICHTPGDQGSLRAGHVSLSFITPTDSLALGAIPFNASTGGVDGGNNTNWLFDGVLPDASPSLITAVARVEQDLPFPVFVFGGQGGPEEDEYALFKRTDTYGTHIIRFKWIIGNPFDVMEVKIPIYPALTGAMKIVPVLYFDNESSSSTGTTIAEANYPNLPKFVGLTSKNFGNKVRGQEDLILELQISGVDLAVLGIPDVEIESYPHL